MITVFTPTYNRAYLLPRLYESLKSQTFKDLEWLIVDDGSTDDTHNLVDRWIEEKIIDVRYYYQENGGKHRAINNGTQLAKGEWFFIVDSDDYLPDNSLEIANKWIDTIKNDNTFAGVSGMIKNCQKIPKVNFDVLDISLLRYDVFYKGDKADVFKTEVIRQYSFPDILGEKYCAESLVWDRIGLKYKFRFFNEIIYYCNYLDDGLTKNSILIRRDSPTYASIVYKQKMLISPLFGKKIKSAINYWRFVWLAKDYPVFIDVPLWSYLFFPIGLCMALRDCLVKAFS